MADFTLPKPIGIPMNDVTKTAAPPTTPAATLPNTPAIPAQPSIAAPIDQAAETAARSAEKFAWSPDQAKQVTGIMDTQRNEYNQRAGRVAKNQMTQQTLAEVERVKGLIAAEVEAIRVLTGEISTINSEISRITSEARSTQSAIDSARSEASRILSTPVTPTTPAAQSSAQPQASAYSPPQQAGTSASVPQAAYDARSNPEYAELHRYYLTEFMPKLWKAEEEALRAINAYKSVHGSLDGIDVKGVRAKYGAKYGVDIVGEAAQSDPKARRYKELAAQAGGMEPTTRVDQSAALAAQNEWTKATGGDWRTWTQADFRKNGYL